MKKIKEDFLTRNTFRLPLTISAGTLLYKIDYNDPSSEVLNALLAASLICIPLAVLVGCLISLARFAYGVIFD